MTPTANTRPAVKEQDLTEFTVRICKIVGGEVQDNPVGTGFVTDKGFIITCAHVIKDGVFNISSLAEAKDREIGVHFAGQTLYRPKRKAKVKDYFSDHDDDIVLLEFTDGASPLVGKGAILGSADKSAGHEFKSYGYRVIDDFMSINADGKIKGFSEVSKKLKLHARPVQLESQDIGPGFSGAPVLDTQRNLIVGVVYKTAYSTDEKNRDTSWAVNAKVIKFEPFMHPLRDEDNPHEPGPEPRGVTLERARELAAPDAGTLFVNADDPIKEWVGRSEMLKQISADWLSPNTAITGLIGYGGEGKSSLARQWVSDLLKDKTLAQPAGVLWWNFYRDGSVDHFFERALDFFSKGKATREEFPSTSIKAEMVAQMLRAHRYLLALDGLEVLQHAEGRQYGKLTIPDMRNFLQFVAAGGHESLCLITSRAYMADLYSYTTYTHRSVERLSKADGRDLMKAVGVTGTDAEIEKVVEAWDGHALTLSLLGGHLVDQHKGDIGKAGEIEPPTSGESRYDRVSRILRRYDEHLTNAERAFLMIFSAYRTSVPQHALKDVFRRWNGALAFNAILAILSANEFDKIIARLIQYRMIRYDANAKQYSAHPLIRGHYYDKLKILEEQVRNDLHIGIANSYIQIHPQEYKTPKLVTRDDLSPWIEASYHLCKAQEYDLAFDLYVDKIQDGDRHVLTDELIMQEVNLDILTHFFSDWTEGDPNSTSPHIRIAILNGIAVSLSSLGRFQNALPFFKRALTEAERIGETRAACGIYSSLSEDHAVQGSLTLAKEDAAICMVMSRLDLDKLWSMRHLSTSIALLGWIEHLQGFPEKAQQNFLMAEKLDMASGMEVDCLYSNRGIWYTDHLKRMGDETRARQNVNANLKISQTHRWLDNISRCYRVLGDLEMLSNKVEQSFTFYKDSVQIARSISQHYLLTQALNARGLFYAKQGEVGPARSDLEEALSCATSGGYRLYEADIRVGLAWMHVADKNKERAQQEAEAAKAMSEEMGYHWGKVDAEEVLAKL